MKRTFVVGDIHGCYNELVALTEKIKLTSDDLLVALGDIVDRGNKSKEVYKYLKERPNTIVIVGNHERKHMNNVLSYAQEIVKLQFGEEYETFLSWLRTLDYYYELDEAIVVHAALENDKPLSQQKEEVLSGSTAGERYLEKKYETGTCWNDYYSGERPVIYGHTVVGESPLVKNNTYGIDTGACHGGYLTAIELPGFIIHQVKAATDYWKNEQRVWQSVVLKSKDWYNMEVTTIKMQLDKLSFVEDTDAKAFLKKLNRWVIQLEELIVLIKDRVDSFTTELIHKHQEQFNIVANKLTFKTFIFKSKAKNLKLDDIKKSLTTPQKIITLAKELHLEDIPVL